MLTGYLAFKRKSNFYQTIHINDHGVSCSFCERNPVYFIYIKQCFGSLLIKIFVVKKWGYMIFRTGVEEKKLIHRFIFLLNSPFQKLSLKECTFLSSLSKAEFYKP